MIGRVCYRGGGVVRLEGGLGRCWGGFFGDLVTRLGSVLGRGNGVGGLRDTDIFV